MTAWPRERKPADQSACSLVATIGSKQKSCRSRPALSEWTSCGTARDRGGKATASRGEAATTDRGLWRASAGLRAYARPASVLARDRRLSARLPPPPGLSWAATMTSTGRLVSTASTHATRRAGVIATPRTRSSAPANADDSYPREAVVCTAAARRLLSPRSSHAGRASGLRSRFRYPTKEPLRRFCAVDSDSRARPARVPHARRRRPATLAVVR